MATTLNHYHFTDSESKSLLKSLVILVDTREQEGKHITDYFDRKGIAYKPYKLDFGDYSAMLPAAPDLGIVRDLYFDRQIIIERKANLTELSGNLSHDRQRFEDEFIRSGGCRKFLLIESGSFDDIITGNYKTELSPGAFLASILTFQQRYSLNISFISKEHSGQFIYGVLYYFLRELIG